MYQEKAEELYQYFLNNTENVNVELLNENFEMVGCLKRSRTRQDMISEIVMAKLHKCHLQYIRKLSDRFCDRIIFMKGILASQDLYGNLEQKKSGDIDILIREEDIDEIGSYLLEEGFCCREDSTMWRQAIRLYHLVFIKREVMGLSVAIEVHGHAFNPPSVHPQFTPYVWERAVYFEQLGVKALVMDVYDRLIHLIVHFYMHCRNLEGKYLGIKGCSFSFRSLMDIYFTIKKYNIDFRILQGRIREVNIIAECYEVLLVLQHIYPDACSEALLCDLKADAARASKHDLFSWRDIIPLYDTLCHCFSQDYLQWIKGFIEYDYSQMQILGADWKTLFECHDACVTVQCSGCQKDAIQVALEWAYQQDWELERCSIEIHYHNGRTDTYLSKIAVNFEKSDNQYRCVFKVGKMQEVYNLKYRFEQSAGGYRCCFEVPRELWGDEVITYSIIFKYDGVWEKCVSGRNWSDYRTMRCLKGKVGYAEEIKVYDYIKNC